MGDRNAVTATEGPAFLAFYDGALPHVYGYHATRCGQRALAEDLTAETFLVAVDAARRHGCRHQAWAWVAAYPSLG